jgi:hypothetical protein
MIKEERLLVALFRNVLALCDGSRPPGAAADAPVHAEDVVWTRRTYWPITNDLVGFKITTTTTTTTTIFVIFCSQFWWGPSGPTGPSPHGGL